MKKSTLGLVCLGAFLTSALVLAAPDPAPVQGTVREFNLRGDGFSFSPGRIEVQKDDRVFGVGGERAAEVYGQTRGADAAGRACKGDDRARAAGTARAAAPLLSHTLQRGGQVFRLKGLREELFRTGPHRSQDQAAVGRCAGNQKVALGR